MTDGVMVTHYMYMTAGIITTSSGIAVLVALFFKPESTSLLFLVENLSTSDEPVEQTMLMKDEKPLQIGSVRSLVTCVGLEKFSYFCSYTECIIYTSAVCHLCRRLVSITLRTPTPHSQERACL